MLRRIKHSVWREERGFALVLTLAYLVMAVPLTIAALQLASQLAMNSRLHQDRLIAMYSSGGALEAAMREIRRDPWAPNDLQLDLNGGTTNVYINLGTSSTEFPQFTFVDAVFALDISGSTNEEQVQLKDAASRIVDAFDLYNNPTLFELGVNRFRGSSDNIVPMTNFDAEIGTPTTDHWGGVFIHDEINGMNGAQLVNGVDIVAALDGGAAAFDTGMGDRTDVPNVIVLILDDEDTEGNTPGQISAASAQTGAEVFAVGVGSISSATLDAIASAPSADHTFYSSDYAGLVNLVESIAQAVKDAGAFGWIYDVQIDSPGGGTMLCRLLYTLDDQFVVISCV